jgi:hypothetical protein
VQARAGDAAVFARGENDEVGVGREIHGRETPLRRLRGVVGQRPAIEVHHVRAGVVDFDPILGVAVLIEQNAVIRRHELGDQHAVGGARRGKE